MIVAGPYLECIDSLCMDLSVRGVCPAVIVARPSSEYSILKAHLDLSVRSVLATVIVAGPSPEYIESLQKYN